MQLTSRDGRRLAAVEYAGASSDWVVIAGATGVPQTYYRALAERLVERTQANVLTLDYRGVGASRVGPMRSEAARYQDWAWDLASAVDHAADRGPTVVVGHSFGGHAYGMTDAHLRTLGLYTFATGAGWGGWMPRRERARVWVLWNVIGPITVGALGYLPFDAMGMGEDLPKGVYEDWRRWCSRPHYFFDFDDNPYEARFASVTAQVTAVNSVDDLWATPASAAAFVSRYPNHELRTVIPAQLGLPAIGHMSYVRPRCAVLWEPLYLWAARAWGRMA